jgi:hypothetical protein
MNIFYIAADFKKIHLKTRIPAILLACLFLLVLQPANAQAFKKHGGPLFDNSRIESNRNPLDAIAPVITYTPLSSTCSVGSNRILSATITDVDGVPTSGAGLPVLYWKINSGPYTAVTANWGGGSVYNFSFGAAAIAGNIVSYYIVAQDNAATPNVIAKPSAGAGGYSTSPPAAATAPTTPDFYVIQTTLAANTYLVGAGQTYVTITDAVNAYNNSCLAGAVVFALTDASYGPSETFPILISNSNASAANTLTIKPNTGVNATISGSAADAIFKFNGADYVTIDGSNSGGTTRNLTIINTNTNTSSTVIWIASFNASNGATNNTIKNCTISGNAGTTTFACITSGSGVTVSAAADAANTNNTYQNNNISTSFYGMYINGIASGETGTVITGNTIGSTLAAKKMGYRAMYIGNQTNMAVNNNTISGVSSAINSGTEPDASGGIFVGGFISGGALFNNRINDIRNSINTGAPSYGISLQSGSNASGLRVYNNFLYEITGYGKAATVADNGHGIVVLTGGGYGIYYNSVHFAPTPLQNVAGNTSCLYIGPNVTGTLDIRNNIFSNRQTNGNRYAIYNSLTSAVFSNINYNDYYSTGLVGFLTTPRATIAAWQAATGSDGNSAATNPIFISNTDLHLQLISPLNDQGTGIAGITTDIDGDARAGVTPDIGADEFTPPPCAANLGGTASTSASIICISGSVILTSTGFSFGVGIAYQWEWSPNNFGTVNNLAGETNPTIANPPSISATTYYRLRVTCNAGVSGYSNVVVVTVNSPAVVTTTPATRCGTGPVVLGATGNAGTVLNWYTAATGGAPLFTGPSFTTPTISATTTYYVEATYIGSSGSCGPVSPTAQGGTISTQLTSWNVNFDVINSTTLVSVDVYPVSAGEASTLEVYNSSGTILTAIPYTTAVSGGATAQTIPINVFLAAGNGYYLYASSGIPPTGLTRNISGGAYPYLSADITITGNGFSSDFFMCYYNWKFSNACSSVRTAVTATVGSPPAISASASPAIVCIGSPTTLTATSVHPTYVYTWTPGPVTGASVSVTPNANTIYTVVADDGSCVTSTTVTVSVKEIPTAVTVTPASATKCINAAAQLLTASGGALIATVLNENFNAPGLPAGWDTTTSVVNSPAKWTLRPNNYSYGGYTFRSNDLSQFYLTNSDAQSSGAITTTLRTPPIDLTGFTSATLTYYQHYLPFNGPESINVEWSANGTSGWTNVYTRTFNSPGVPIGTSIGFVLNTIDLSVRAGTPVTYLRFRYVGRQDFWWAIDNVKVTGGSGSTPITWTPTTGLFTNAAATIPYTGTVTPTVYANPAVTTTYTATATSVNSCFNTNIGVMTIHPVVTGVISPASTAICPAGTATISIALTGTAPWTLTYTDGSTPVTVNNILTSPYTFTVSPAATTTYSITALSDVNCTAISANYTSPPNSVVNVSTVTFSTWTGGTTDWNTASNWCGGVPTNAKDVIIPNGTPFYPVITTGTPAAKNLTINNGGSVTINAGGVLSITGNMVNDGTLTNNGSIILNGTLPQGFPGVSTTGVVTAMRVLEVNKTSGLTTFNNKFPIDSLLKPTAGAIAVNDTVTIRSVPSGTASIDKVGATASFAYGTAGRFIVERYIPTGVSHGKSWQLLSAPTFGQTVNAAWQEGASGPASNPKPGYGTTITSNVAGALAAGFDFATPAGGTMKTYNPATNQFDGIANTLSLQIANPKGYMLFVRGDRSVVAYNQAATATTLRTTGKLYSPGADAPPSSTVLPNHFESVGNPYASTIDFTSLLSTSTGLDTKYYVWDPLMPGSSGYGAYQTISSSNGYKPVPGGTANYNALLTYSKIQSGQAFFVYSTPGGTVNFSENNKISGNQMVFRQPEKEKERQYLRVNLHTGNGELADGNVLALDPDFSNGFESNDALKMGNIGENFGILHNGKTLAVNARMPLRPTDTVFYTFNTLRTQAYQLRFAPENMQMNQMSAFLVDRFRGVQLPVSLSDSTTIMFEITSDPASKASDRFYLIFRKWRTLPVMFTLVDAQLNGKEISVNWKVENQVNISAYEVEKSADGNSFTKIGTRPAQENGNRIIEYGLVDANPFVGNNYYRIRSISGNPGEARVSEMVKVWAGEENETITVYPNPVRDKSIGLHFTQAAPGNYKIRLLNANGQEIYNRILSHQGQRASYKLLPSSVISTGIYMLDITSPTGVRTLKKLVVE